MTGMELYVRFMFTLALGLAGLAFVLTTVLERLLHDWDPGRDLYRWWRYYIHSRHVHAVRAEDILLEAEALRRGRYEPPAPATTLDRRREELRALSEAESRLAAPRASLA